MTTAKACGTQRGFTLLEMVVAMLLLGVLSVMTFYGVQGVWRVDRDSSASGEQQRALQRAWQLISSDMLALRPRLFADGRGGWQPAFETGTGGALVRFSRAAEARTASNPSGLTRINYRLEEGQLWRDSWPATTSAAATPDALLLLSGVDAVTVETLSADNRFTPNWPPLNEQLTALSLPRMIRIQLLLDNGEQSSKLLPGVVDALDQPWPGRESPND